MFANIIKYSQKFSSISDLRYSIGKRHCRQPPCLTVFTHYFIVHRTNIKLSAKGNNTSDRGRTSQFQRFLLCLYLNIKQISFSIISDIKITLMTSFDVIISSCYSSMCSALQIVFFSFGGRGGGALPCLFINLRVPITAFRSSSFSFLLCKRHST